MSNYIVGDIHGCYRELKLVLKKANFNVKKDILWVTGDLINRGPDSFEVLRYIKRMGNSAKMVLGNHDLNFIIKYSNFSELLKKKKSEKDIEVLLNWLRNQLILRVDHKKKIIMSHAGMSPQWSLTTAEFCAQEVHSLLQSEKFFLLSNFVNKYRKNRWSNKLSKFSRICFSINALTKMRYCFLNGDLNMNYSLKTIKNKKNKPWFDFLLNIPKGYSIIFGHWSSIDGNGTPSNIYGLDTGCCWGRKLTLLRWEDKKYFTQNSLLKRSLF